MAYPILAAAVLLLTGLPDPLAAEGFLCAGQLPGAITSAPRGLAPKPTQARTTGTRQALVLFARFKGEPVQPVPPWAADLLNPNQPGSFSHFYDTMSFGKLQVRGQVAPRVCESTHEAGYYLAVDDTTRSRYDQLAREILQQVDQGIDLAQYDNDGPDAIPNSGDDDGVVDAVFIVLDTVPARFLLGNATGIGDLGFGEPFVTGDAGHPDYPVRVVASQGTIEQGRTFAGTVGAMCHEYGHVLGLPDLYNIDFLQTPGAPPGDDSAGVGNWCLMGWGASGWNGDDGPNSLCAWSRMQLGWAEVQEVAQAREAGLADVGRRGQVYRVPLGAAEYFLLENRSTSSTCYDRSLPAAGLLIWHVRASQVTLRCADGRWQDAGFPLGRTPDPRHGQDNLGFWAHDPAYAAQHGGNLGDATDPFDGVRFTAFTPDTNPDSYSDDSTRSVRIEAIRLEPGLARAQVQTTPAQVAAYSVKILGTKIQQALSYGEAAWVSYTLGNEGGVVARNVRVRLTAADTLIEVSQAEAAFGDLEPGY